MTDDRALRALDLATAGLSVAKIAELRHHSQGREGPH